MARWKSFPYDAAAYTYDTAHLGLVWPRLHTGDLEPWPKDAGAMAAWSLFHAGSFRASVDAGLAAGGAGITAANKAQSIYAHYLERDTRAKSKLFQEVARRAAAQQRAEPKNPNAWYWYANALGRYGQTIGVLQALGEGIGGKVKGALERTIAMAPRHADAHVALGAFHAEVIAHVGGLLAHLQGADAATGIKLFRRALKLDPRSAIAKLEAARGLPKLDGTLRGEARRLLAAAAATTPLDAMERLDVEAARAELRG